MSVNRVTQIREFRGYFASYMTSWPKNYFNWVTTFRIADTPSADRQLAVELSWVVSLCTPLRRNSTQLDVETSSWVELCRYKRGFSQPMRPLIHSAISRLQRVTPSQMSWLCIIRIYIFYILFADDLPGCEGDGVLGCWDADADRSRIEITRDTGRLIGCLLSFLLLLQTTQWFH